MTFDLTKKPRKTLFLKMALSFNIQFFFALAETALKKSKIYQI